MPKFILHDQGDDAIDDRYSLITEAGQVALLFNTTFLGITANEVERVFNAHHPMLAALEMFEGAFASDIETDDEMGGADTVESVCTLWHHFIKPALAAARGETRTYARPAEQEV